MNIPTLEGIKTIDKGYIGEIKVNGFSFSVMIHRPLDGDKTEWYCSEYTTGYRLCSGATRKEALEKARGLIIKATPEITQELIVSKKIINVIDKKKREVS